MDLSPRPPGWLPAALAVAGGLAALAVPGLGAGAALAGGVALALTSGNPLPRGTRRLAKALLPASVVALGGGMDLGVVARVGARGVGYTLATLAVCGGLGALLGAGLRIRGRTRVLITVGTAICGGSAIAAAAPVIGADEDEASVALGTVFLLNGVALLAFPVLGHLASLREESFGLWAALAIHDTSSVVGATLRYGPAAVAVGTTVKLARALWIVPITLALGLAARRAETPGEGRTGPRLASPPWFIAGFVALAAVTTWWPAARPAGVAIAHLGQRALVLTLFLVGLGLSRAGLRKVGVRPLALGLALWVTMAALTLAAVRAGVAHL